MFLYYYAFFLAPMSIVQGSCTRRVRGSVLGYLELLPSLTCILMALTSHHNFYKNWYMVNLSLILWHLCLYNEDSLFIFHPTVINVLH